MFTEDQITKGTKAAIDHLLFAQYMFNRQNRPDISPERWGKIYGDEKVLAMEKEMKKLVASH